MKSYRGLTVGVALLLAGAAGLMATGSWNFMGSMMDRGGMRGMMGAQLPPGIELEELPESQSSAAKLLAQYCTQCHALPDPKQHTADEWPAVVQRMEKNMNSMGRPVPDEEAIKTILGFLQKHAR